MTIELPVEVTLSPTAVAKIADAVAAKVKHLVTPPPPSGPVTVSTASATAVATAVTSALSAPATTGTPPATTTPSKAPPSS